jgi:hypothetical protein
VLLRELWWHRGFGGGTRENMMVKEDVVAKELRLLRKVL